MARLVSQRLAERWGQQVIVDNRAGGNTVIGSEAAAKSRPDGYTMLLMTMDQTIIANLFSIPYDAVKDFAPVATFASTELVLAINPRLPADNLQDRLASLPQVPTFTESGLQAFDVKWS